MHLNSSHKATKLFVIGLDCAPPELVFEQYRHLLPNLDRLMRQGVYGRLRSCTPCITVPAWSVMTASQDPGMLGIYGFRNRADYSYERMTIATSAAVKVPRVWDLLGQAGKRVVTIGVPGTYPPRPVNGAQISCFLTPQTVAAEPDGTLVSKTFTYPPELGVTVNDWAGGEYLVDVRHFRTDDKDYLLRQIYDMSQQHFQVVRKLMEREAWDFFMFVEMATDRLHHGFWKYIDPRHVKYQAGNQFETSVVAYYQYLDGEIGTLLSLLDNDTAVIVVSDHGAQSMDGGICINEWLIRNGWLTLAESRPAGLTPLERVKVDWKNTRAWGEGGYYGRVFLNVTGREPSGCIAAEDFERVRDELARDLCAIRGPGGKDIGSVVHKPQDIYRQVRGIAPDLIVYFGNLRWRSVGSLGHPEVWTLENDTGPDDANHAEDGIFVYHDPRQQHGGHQLSGLEIMDFAPTVLQHFGLPIPANMQGRVMPMLAG